MNSIEITSFAKYVEATEKFDFWTDVVLFRGQAFKGNLLPGIARKDPKADTEKIERQMLDQIRLRGSQFIPTGASDLELMVLAQHFGLRTRLLDWSSNPLAAMYFACASYQTGSVYVYALEADTFLEANVYDTDPFTPSKTKAFQPKLNNPRIIAQQGWFTLHRRSRRSGRYISLETNGTAKKLLTEYHVPAGARVAMLDSLNRHGVNAATVYPDLEGLCRHLNWKSGAG